jgi:branched-chain amino acid aminotransferase
VPGTYPDGIAFIEGCYRPIGEARIPILDLGFLRSDANQDTVSVWGGSFFRLDDHQERFERNIARLRMHCPHDRQQRNEILAECVRRTGFRNAYVQMVMTRGRLPAGSRDIRGCANQFHAFCLPYVWLAPEEQRRRGLHAHISDIQRVPPQTIDSTVKHYHWLDFELGLMQAYDAGAETVIVVDGNGGVAEGPGFNVFSVNGGTVTTPGGTCLEGITRRTALDLLGELNVTGKVGIVSPDDLRGADEVFLTSTAGGILPVTKIDHEPVGDGAVGPLTERLRALYWERHEDDSEATSIDYEG